MKMKSKQRADHIKRTGLSTKGVRIATIAKYEYLIPRFNLVPVNHKKYEIRWLCFIKVSYQII